MPKVQRLWGYAALQPAAGKSHGKCVTPGSALPSEPELQKSTAGHAQTLDRVAGNREELCFCLFFLGLLLPGRGFRLSSSKFTPERQALELVALSAPS